MSTQSTQPRAGGGERLERAIILQLLCEDRRASWSREELAIELGGEMPLLEDALLRLRDDGLISIVDQRVSASRAARRLDELGLIGV
jgi:transcription initiation factor IIE alpha subunit